MLRIRPSKAASTAGPTIRMYPARTTTSGAASTRVVGERRVVAARDERGLDPLLRGPVEGRAGPVGEDEDDLAAELAARRGGVERPQVGAGTRDADRDPAAHATRLEGALDVARAADGGRLDDLADDGRRDPLPRQRGDRRGRGRRRHDHDHAQAAVERRPQLVVVEPAERAEQAHDRRHRPARRVQPGGQPGRQRARHVPGQAAAGDVGETVDVGAVRDDRLAGREHGPRVDPRRGQQDLAERRHRFVRRGGQRGVRGGIAERPAQPLLVRARARSRSHWATSARTSE